jgi:hypothetical protein
METSKKQRNRQKNTCFSPGNRFTTGRFLLGNRFSIFLSLKCQSGKFYRAVFELKIKMV